MSPRISVIIPTYGRPDKLRACLEAFSNLIAPSGGFEIIVVNDGDAVPLDSVAHARLVEQAHAGPASARNRGAEEARGDYLAFIDDDCIPSPQWLTALETAIANRPHAALGGHVVNAVNDNPFSAASQLIVDYLYQCFFDREHALTSDAKRFFTSNNLCVPRRAFQEIGGFEKRFPLAAAEDREFCERWANRGGELVYVPEAIVLHQHDLSFAGFCRQHFNYGRGVAQLQRFNKSRTAVHTKGAMFYAKLIAFPATKKSEHNSLFLSMLMCVSQAATASGYYWEALTNRRSRSAAGA